MVEKRYNYKVYTPSEIAKSIVKKGLDLYFQGEFTKEKLDNLKVCDLSCGNGNLLLPLLEELIHFSKKIMGKYSYNHQCITG